MNSNNFKDRLSLAYQLLNNEKWDETLQSRAVSLLEELRQEFPEIWNATWKYDAFLGYAYHITLQYEKRFEAYKRACEKIDIPPPELLVAMARCYRAPGVPPITKEEAVCLVSKAIKDIPYIEGVELLIGLYKSMGNNIEQEKWEKFLASIQDKIIHLPSLDQVI